jgi:hypothetical protein
VGFNLGKWVSNAVKTAGKPIEWTGKALQDAGGAVTHELGKIPVVGAPIGALFDAPFQVAFGPAIVMGRIAHGDRIDRAVMAQISKEVKDVKEIAPYAQMVISLVPGVGQGISAALGAGLALAEGQGITEALLAGVKGAVPGGPIAAGLVEAGAKSVEAAAHHTKLDWALVSQIAGDSAATMAGLPDVAKNAIAGALDTASKVAHGVPVDIALANGALDAAGTSISADAKKALQMGVALGHGAFLQKQKAPQLQGPVTDKLAALGQNIASTDTMVATALGTLRSGQHGFYVGVGMSRQQIGVNDLTTVRTSLSPDDQKGFDLAMSLHIGRVTNPMPAELGIRNEPVASGYFATMGMQGNHPDQNAAVMTALASAQHTRMGATVALDHVAQRRNWWHRFLTWLGIEH